MTEGLLKLPVLPFFIRCFHLPANFGVIRERLASAKDVCVFRREPMAAISQVAHIRIQFWEVTGDEYSVSGLPLGRSREGKLVQRKSKLVRDVGCVEIAGESRCHLNGRQVQAN